MTGPRRPPHLALRLYHLALILLPRSFRDQFEEDMILLFAERMAEARASRRGRARLWMGALADLLRASIALRVGSDVDLNAALEAPRRRRSPLGRDLRFAFRTLRRAPGFALTASATLAIGIAATTVMVSLVRGVLLRPLPYAEPDDLVWIAERAENGAELAASYPNFADWREQSRGFDGLIAGFPVFSRTVGAANGPVSSPTMGVSRDFFEVLGVLPIVGRSLAPEETRPGGPLSVVVSYGFWSRELGGRALTGLTLQFDDEVAEVVGIMPPGFEFMEPVDVWWSFERSPIEIRNAHNYWVVGRLGPTASLSSAHADLDGIAAAIAEAYPDETSSRAVWMRSLHEQVVGGSRRHLTLLLSGAVLLLLIACSNIASMLLVRGADRSRELSVRASIGARRGDIVRQLLTESVVLATIGATLGILLGTLVMRGVRASAVGMIPRLEAVQLDLGVLFAVVAISLGATLLFGLGPARRSSAGASSPARGTTPSGSESALWRVLVAGEVALATLLLIGSGLLVRSLAEIFNADLGYDGSRIVSVSFAPPGSRYPSESDRLEFVLRAMDELRNVPGVQSVGLTGHLPMQWSSQTGPVVLPPFGNLEDPDEWDARAGFRIVDEHVFQTLGVPLLAGRTVEPTDIRESPPVAVVNAALAQRLWPDEDPLGQQLVSLWDFEHASATVVGVVGEARHWSVEIGGQPEVYMSVRQRPVHVQRGVRVVVRAADRPGPLVRPIRDRLSVLDPDLRPTIRTVPDAVRASVADRRFTLFVLLGFAIAGLLLSGVGVYGVVAYTVARRAREIGIRLALGARPESVVARVQRRTLLWVGSGVLLGSLVALATARVVASFLYDVTPRDPATYAAVALTLLGIGFCASYVPARRSSRIDPGLAMRGD